MLDCCPHCLTVLAGSSEATDAAPAPIAASIAAVAPTITKQKPTDVLTLARARLETLEIELASYEDKRREADMLRRMIAAASEPN